MEPKEAAHLRACMHSHSPRMQSHLSICIPQAAVILLAMPEAARYRTLMELEVEYRRRVLAAMPPKERAMVLSEMTPQERVEEIGVMRHSDRAGCLEFLKPSDRKAAVKAFCSHLFRLLLKIVDYF